MTCLSFTSPKNLAFGGAQLGHLHFSLSMLQGSTAKREPPLGLVFLTMLFPHTHLPSVFFLTRVLAMSRRRNSEYGRRGVVAADLSIFQWLRRSLRLTRLVSSTMRRIRILRHCATCSDTSSLNNVKSILDDVKHPSVNSKSHLGQ